MEFIRIYEISSYLIFSWGSWRHSRNNSYFFYGTSSSVWTRSVKLTCHDILYFWKKWMRRVGDERIKMSYSCTSGSISVWLADACFYNNNGLILFWNSLLSDIQSFAFVLPSRMFLNTVKRTYIKLNFLTWFAVEDDSWKCECFRSENEDEKTHENAKG